MAEPRTPRPARHYRHFLAIPTRWMDNDTYGHVNNVTYYSYFDTVVNEHLINAGGLDIRDGPVVGLRRRDLLPLPSLAVLSGDVDAGLRVTRLGRRSVTYEIALVPRAATRRPPRRGGSCTCGSTAGRSGRPTFPRTFAPRSRRSSSGGRMTVRAGPATAAACAAPVAAMTGVALRCEPMTAATRADARALLGAFLDDDAHYRASAAAYGDGGGAALDACPRPLPVPARDRIRLARVRATRRGDVAVGACVVCRAISTSRGTIVAKLDDVSVHPDWQGRGVGAGMLAALREHLRADGTTRIDCGCHRANDGAWRFYERMGFLPLDEERIALLL